MDNKLKEKNVTVDKTVVCKRHENIKPQKH
jgi:hypothetical protein